MAITITEFDPDRLAPLVETGVFADHPQAPFWIGRVASGNLVEMPREYQAAHILRANVYIDEEHFLPHEARSANGGEYDQDDERSLQFAILENRAGEARAVGTVRLVEKRDSNDLLPAEVIFPEAFETSPAEVGSLEVSRLIARHPNSATQTLASLAAIRVSDLYCIDKQVPNTYAVVERALYIYLRRLGVPCEQMSELKTTPEYGDTANMVVRINPQEMYDRATSINSKHALLIRFFDQVLKGLGLGYFDASFSPLHTTAEV